MPYKRATLNSQEIATTLLGIMHINMLYEAKVVGPAEPIVIHDAFLRFVKQYQVYRIFIMSQGLEKFGGVRTLHIDPLVVAKSITPHGILSFTQALEGFKYKDFNPVGQYRHHHPSVTPQRVLRCKCEGHAPAPDNELVLFLYSDGSV
jgi:hypothetical protein